MAKWAWRPAPSHPGPRGRPGARGNDRGSAPAGAPVSLEERRRGRDRKGARWGIGRVGRCAEVPRSGQGALGSRRASLRAPGSSRRSIGWMGCVVVRQDWRRSTPTWWRSPSRSTTGRWPLNSSIERRWRAGPRRSQRMSGKSGWRWDGGPCGATAASSADLVFKSMFDAMARSEAPGGRPVVTGAWWGLGRRPSVRRRNTMGRAPSGHRRCGRGLPRHVGLERRQAELLGRCPRRPVSMEPWRTRMAASWMAVIPCCRLASGPSSQLTMQAMYCAW